MYQKDPAICWNLQLVLVIVVLCVGTIMGEGIATRIIGKRNLILMRSP